MKKNYAKPTYIRHKISNVISVNSIVTIHYFEFGKNFDFHFEKHDLWEMVYIDSGEAKVETKNVSYTLNQGDVIFIKPNEIHKLCGNGIKSFNAFIITFGASLAGMDFFKNKKLSLPQGLKKYVALILNEGSNAFLLPKNDPYLVELKENPDAPVGSVQMIRSYLEQLLILLMRAEEKNSTNIFFDRENMENYIVVSVKKILKSNLYGRISADEICSELHYSRTYLSKLFKKSCRCTINTYYTEMKIKEAKKLICEDRYNFTQISEMLGFDNPHYFTRVFKRVTNMTPTEFYNSSKI